MPRWRIALAVLLLSGTLGACGPARPPAPLPYAEHPDLHHLNTEPLRGRHILIDPGHGGDFAGAVGDAGTREADVNLGVALYLWGLLHDAGADVQLTRASDRDLLPGGSSTLRDDLAARVQAIAALRPDVFLSLHHNSNAARNRERNAIETYFKLDDAGPSLDLGNAIAARLAQHLNIAPAQLVPGNFYVLRDAPAAAVLGEASYLSNPGVEARLQLVSSQRLEAEAYFLGLLDYFSRGAAAIRSVEPAGDTLQAGAGLRFSVAEAVDPLTLEVRADGVPIAACVEPQRGDIVAGRDLAPGPHTVVVRARLARGNAAQPWRGRIFVRTRAARVILAQEPDPATCGSRIRLSIVTQDAAGVSLGSGVPVTLHCSGAEILTAETSTTDGTIIALARVLSASASVTIDAGGLSTTLPLRVGTRGPWAPFVRCADARDARCIPHAWLGDGAAQSDRAGILALPAGADSLHVAARGYLPWDAPAPPDSILRLVPVYGGRLQDVAVVLDPAGGGADVQLTDGRFAARASFEVCRALRDLLQAGGAQCALTRAATESPSDLQRLERALDPAPAWFVGVECGRSPGFVVHDPGSAAGERLAHALATWLARRLGTPFAVRGETRFLLRQTPCPAVIVHLPLEKLPAENGDRLAAYALFLGMQSGMTPAALASGTLAGRVAPELRAALVTLDEAAALPVGRDGRFQFEALEAGVHRLRILGAWPSQHTVRVPSAADTVHVEIDRPSR